VFVAHGAIAALAGDHKNEPIAARRAAMEERSEHGVCFALGHAVKVDARVDLSPAGCDPSLFAAVEFGRRRGRDP
jgi:hypothetical protein